MDELDYNSTASYNVTEPLFNETSSTQSSTQSSSSSSSSAATTTSTAASYATQVHNVTKHWNLTRVGDTGVSSSTASICTTTVSSTTTEDPFDEFGPPEGVEYIFVPLGVMIFVIVLSAVVIIISRKRKLERLRHRLMPLYNFDPGEEGEDDWETELLDEGFSSRQRRQGYQSMDSEENSELFSTERTQPLG